MYEPDIIVRAFQYFVTSRSLYHQLREEYELPSIKTLTRITSKIAKIGNEDFYANVFSDIDNHQKNCVLLQDEVYIKKMLTYHGGTIFGQSENNESLAETMLGIMVTCLHGGPKFLSRMIPASKLDSEYLHQQVNDNLASI